MEGGGDLGWRVVVIWGGGCGDLGWRVVVYGGRGTWKMID